MPASERFPVDVLIVVVRAGKILLTERAGDVYLTGHWAVPSGKVDDGEDVLTAAARELHEEVDLHVEHGRLSFVGVTHHRPPHGDSRVGFGFTVELPDAEPRNAEPDKCAQLRWCDPHTLPHPTMPYTLEIVRLFLNKEVFSLHGWNPPPA